MTALKDRGDGTAPTRVRFGASRDAPHDGHGLLPYCDPASQSPSPCGASCFTCLRRSCVKVFPTSSCSLVKWPLSSRRAYRLSPDFGSISSRFAIAPSSWRTKPRIKIPARDRPRRDAATRLAALSILCFERRRVAGPDSFKVQRSHEARGSSGWEGKMMPIIWWLFGVPFTVILLLVALGVIHF
jgi:hypothetical protein